MGSLKVTEDIYIPLIWNIFNINETLTSNENIIYSMRFIQYPISDSFWVLIWFIACGCSIFEYILVLCDQVGLWDNSARTKTCLTLTYCGIYIDMKTTNRDWNLRVNSIDREIGEGVVRSVWIRVCQDNLWNCILSESMYGDTQFSALI